MTSHGRSKFIKVSTGAWVNLNDVLYFSISERNLSYDNDEPYKFNVSVTVKYNSHVFSYYLAIKPSQEDWTRERWQDYLDNFMYEQGLFNGEEY